MSTKIYDGMIYKGKGGMVGCLDTLNRIRTGRYMKKAKALFTELRENGFVGKEYDMLETVQNIAKTEKRVGNWLDISCSVAVIPVIHKGEEYILCHAFGGHMGQDILKGHPSFKFFGYWDNTDPDEGCTAEEWGLRETLWKLAMKRGGSFDQMGFLYEIGSERTIFRAWYEVGAECRKKIDKKKRTKKD